MRKAHRTDKNHAEVRDGLRRELAIRRPGWVVVDTSSAGDGVPDLFVLGDIDSAAPSVIPIEVKDGGKPPSARRLTPAEAEWGTALRVARSLDEVRCVVGLDPCVDRPRCGCGGVEDPQWLVDDRKARAKARCR